jgi:hypothetical protein
MYCAFIQKLGSDLQCSSDHTLTILNVTLSMHDDLLDEMQIVPERPRESLDEGADADITN